MTRSVNSITLAAAFLYAWFPGSVFSEKDFAFDISLDVDDVEVVFGTTSSGSKQLQFALDYDYSGPLPVNEPMVNFGFDIRKSDCFSEPLETPDPVQLATLDDVAFDTSVSGKVSVRLDLNLGVIAQSSLWSQDDEAMGTIAFCGRFNVQYDDVLVNLHEAVVTTEIDLTQGDGFAAFSLQLHRADTSMAEKEAQITVYHGDEAGEAVAAPDSILQGEPLRLCVKTAVGALSNTNVYVQNIEELTWSASTTPATSFSPVLEGTARGMSVLECAQKPGVCCVQFFVGASTFLMFEDTAELTITGSVALALGEDDSRRQLANKRLLEDLSNDDPEFSEFQHHAGVLKRESKSSAGGPSFFFGLEVTLLVMYFFA
ncbi:expressed unknown protein [Seminavis robusta]|uniref:Uncharacterized protein n=1 Tax=Seminavis robusta TaxID=568900 RepID=A0A9N8H1X8_9STRA|nr:expressed unknown protein [Seminavis robusta]|eukprot:Sro9_g007480.1 n/a (372) ;mRNA; f:158592-159707